MNHFEIEAFIYDKKIGTILLKDGRVYFEYDKEFKNSKLEIWLYLHKGTKCATVLKYSLIQYIIILRIA